MQPSGVAPDSGPLHLISFICRFPPYIYTYYMRRRTYMYIYICIYTYTDLARNRTLSNTTSQRGKESFDSLCRQESQSPRLRIATSLWYSRRTTGVRTYIHADTHAYTYAAVYTCRFYIYIYLYICRYKYIYGFICIYMCTCMYTYTCMCYAYTYTCIHTYVPMQAVCHRTPGARIPKYSLPATFLGCSRGT